MSLARDLETLGRPLISEQLRHPTVAGIGRGDLDAAVFRSWLEQDYLFLHDYVRVFARLAWQAPDEHLGDLVELAHSTFFEELSLHRALAAEFDADLDGAAKGPACAAYTEFLLESAASYGEGLAALYPCMWGYSTLGRLLAQDPPPSPATVAGSRSTPTPPSRCSPAASPRCSTRRPPTPGSPVRRSPRACAMSWPSGTCRVDTRHTVHRAVDKA